MKKSKLQFGHEVTNELLTKIVNESITVIMQIYEKSKFIRNERMATLSSSCVTEREQEFSLNRVDSTQLIERHAAKSYGEDVVIVMLKEEMKFSECTGESQKLHTSSVSSSGDNASQTPLELVTPLSHGMKTFIGLNSTLKINR